MEKEETKTQIGKVLERVLEGESVKTFLSILHFNFKSLKSFAAAIVEKVNTREFNIVLFPHWGFSSCIRQQKSELR